MTELDVCGLLIVVLGLAGGLVQVRRCAACGRRFWPRRWSHRHWHSS